MGPTGLQAVAMLVLVCLLILMMKSDAASAEIISAHSGGAVLLTSNLQGLKPRQDVRWTHPHLVMSLKNNVTTCHHGHCELLSDGSLRFSRVQTADAGNYSLEVFDEDGKRLMKRDFLLRVEDNIDNSNSMVVSMLVCCILVFLVLLFITFFILKRRRNQRIRTTGPLDENVYVVMHGHHDNQGKDEEKQESSYVPCHPVSMETPITEQMPVDVEDIYV